MPVNVGMDVGKREHLDTVGASINEHRHFGNYSVSKKTLIKLPYDPTVQPLDIVSKDPVTHCPALFSTALSTHKSQEVEAAWMSTI